MNDLQFWIVMLAAGSLYCNYLLCKKLKVVENIREDNYKVYLSKCKEMSNRDEYKDKKIEELEEKYNNLEMAYDELIKGYKEIDKQLYYWRLLTAPKPLKKNKFFIYNKNKAIGLR